MRPIDKGSCPQVAGIDKTVTEYGHWRRDLIARIGYYCVYCNMPLSEQLQVEHAVPKVPLPGAPVGSLLDWSNMLLACGPCNRAKWNYTSNGTLHYLPEEHNTHLPFSIVQDPVHVDAAIVQVRGGLAQPQITKAEDTIAFFDLDVFDSRDKIIDLRWMRRKKAMDSVEGMYEIFQIAKVSPTYDATIMSEAIAKIAAECGFFSLWYEKFQNEADVMKALTDNSIIKGTATNCFDPTNGYKPIFRNTANLADPI